MNSSALSVVVSVACVMACVPAGLRWLRVSQREHYLPGSASRFAARWWTTSATNAGLAIVGSTTLVAVWWFPVMGLLAGLVAVVGPSGLPVRGRTSKLAWTRRAKSLAAVTAVLGAVVVVVGFVLGRGPAGAATACLLAPLLVDAAASIMAPIEEVASRHFLDEAKRRLARVSPTVVAITGSYGKTTTKNHLAGLIGNDRVTVPSPRSFNNRAGLARAINEHLADGTQVFIAEMGTYGPGEIASMCEWCPPRISMITAIGPVHLERFGSLEVTLSSKAEIAVPAETVVLNVDDTRLAGLADQLIASGKEVIRAGSTSDEARVVVAIVDGSWSIRIDGAVVGTSPAIVGVQPTNVACALGAALALGLDATDVAGRVRTLSNVENRLEVATVASGVVVVDDTFNSNPAGAAAALNVLTGLEVAGRRAVVTPGMIELGPSQKEENERFAHDASEVADIVVIVGRTNRRALRRGLVGQNAQMVEVPTRRAAVDWVRANLGPGDAVLYENDLPDNYP